MAVKRKNKFRLFARLKKAICGIGTLAADLANLVAYRQEQRKLHWGTLLLISVIAFVLFSNSRHANIQNDAIAKEIPPNSMLTEPPALSDSLLYIDPIPGTDPQIDAGQMDADELNAAELDADQEPSEGASGETLGDNDASNGKEAASKAPSPETPYMYSVTVRSGDTLSDLLNRFDASSSLDRIRALGKAAKPLLNLKAGKKMYLDTNDSGQLEQLVYAITPSKHLVLEKSSDGKMTLKEHLLPIEKNEVSVTGVVDKSFYLSARELGIPDEIIIEAANILAWDIDFALDIRKGDFFAILYEEETLRGKKIGYGDVVGVEFINRGKTHRAMRYTDQSDQTAYFTPDGKRVKKPFLRAPLDFTRVSSHFNPKRLHPILRKVRPHRGVDYAAKTGTPVYATAAGKIIFRGWKNGYGNVVILQHHAAYTTLYAHLSKFKRGLRKGSRVKQGQTIGYVGMTGWATGPHLHYEFRVNGVHKNPIKVKLPDSKPLPKSVMAHFKKATNPILAKLNTLNQSHITLNERQ